MGEFRIPAGSTDGPHLVSEAVQRTLQHLKLWNGNVLVVCIGSDRSIGDALGPMVGTMLKSRSSAASEAPSYQVYGDLEDPIHAMNLPERLRDIMDAAGSGPVIAVDACLGRMESVGSITIGQGSLKPGAGVNKSLPEIGSIYVTGVVNVGGFMEYFVLQNTRLGLVHRLAQTISQGLDRGLNALAVQSSAQKRSNGTLL